MHRIKHLGMAVAENHRPPRTNIVGIALAVGIPQVCAVRFTDEAWGTTHRFEGAHGRIHPTGNAALGTGEKAAVEVGRHEKIPDKFMEVLILALIRPPAAPRSVPKIGAEVRYAPCPV